jgi:hypothetical protein
MVTPEDRQAAQQRRIIDASVHVFSESNGDMRSYMQEPFKSRGVPDVETDWYGAPGGEYVPWAERPGIYPGVPARAGEPGPARSGSSSCSWSSTPARGRRSWWRPHACAGTWESAARRP